MLHEQILNPNDINFKTRSVAGRTTYQILHKGNQYISAPGSKITEEKLSLIWHVLCQQHELIHQLYNRIEQMERDAIGLEALD